MSLSESIIQIKYGDLKQIEERGAKLAAENAKLAAELTEAKLGSSDSLCREYHAALLAAMPIVRFAVANMDPLSFAGWPHAQLTQVATALGTLPGIDLDQQETAGDLKLFASDCAKVERARADGTQKELLAAMNAGKVAEPPL